MMRTRWLHLGLLVVVLALGVAGGVWIRNRIVEPTVGRHAEADLDKAVACRQEAAAFTDYPLLFAGDTVLGYPLRSCRRSKTANQYDDQGRLFHSATDFFSFFYGTYVIPAGRESCGVPVTIIIDPPGCGFTVDPSLARERVTVGGARALVDEHGVIWFDTPSYKISVYPPGDSYADQKANAVAIVEDLVGANALAAALTSTAPLTTPLGPSTATCGAGDTPLTTATPPPATPTPPLPATIAVGAPSLAGGKVQFAVSTTGTVPQSYSAFTVHVRWDPAVFSFSSADSNGSVLASLLCAEPALDDDASGVTYTCVSSAAPITATGLLATFALTPALTGCSALHLFTYGPPDNGGEAYGTFVLTSGDDRTLQYVDGRADVRGQPC